MQKLSIDTMQEYELVRSKGHEPLLPNRYFSLSSSLRREIQRQIFGRCVTGRGDVAAANERFYRWVWKNKPHYCEECMKPLREYSSVYVSHILTRGAHPDMAHDPRNIIILCFNHHNQWENGDRRAMRIYEKNVETIELLKNEYQVTNP